MFKFISTSAALVGALAAFTGVAAAEEGVKVSYGDLDLSRPADAAEFDARTSKAARKFCRSDARPVGTFIRDTRGCMNAVRVSVLEELPAHERQALAAARTRASTVLASR